MFLWATKKRCDRGSGSAAKAPVGAARAGVAPVVLAVVLVLAGCASDDYNYDEQGAYDPLEGPNRLIYQINKRADAVLISHLAKAYQTTPDFVQTGVGNFVDNLKEPGNMVNHGLQGSGGDALISFGRLGINTFVGVGGLVDFAGLFGVEQKPADFGQTLRGYGFSDPPYLVLPLLGPSSTTDAIGTAVDTFADPVYYVDEDGVRYVITGVRAAHGRAQASEVLDLAETTALDEYVFIRELYEENRRQSVPAEGYWTDESWWSWTPRPAK